MAKATTRHLCFTLNRSAVNFVTLQNIQFIIANKTAKFDDLSAPNVDQITYSYSRDFSSLFIEAQTTLSIYNTDDLSTAINNTLSYFNNTDWTNTLPEPLNTLYKINLKSLPTKQNIIIEKESINNLVRVKHRIELNAKLSEIKSKVSTYLAKKIREPLYFTSVSFKGVKPNTCNQGLDLHINTRHNIAKAFPTNWNGSFDPTYQRQQVIFRNGFLNFAHNSTDQDSGFMHLPNLNAEVAKISLAFHSTIEMVVEYKGKQISYAACLVSPVIKQNHALFSDLDLSTHLHCGSNKTEIKRAILEKCFKGAKVVELKITSMKRKVALSNHAKYQQITYIGLLFGYCVVAEISKNGSIKISELDGGYFYDSSARERFERGVKDVLVDLFSNDREYASYLFYRLIYANNTKNSYLLFS